MVLAVVTWEHWPSSNLCLGLGEKRADPDGLLWNTHRSSAFSYSLFCPDMVLWVLLKG